MAERTRSSVLETLRTNTSFLDSAPMQRLLETSDFDLAALKADPKGLTIYLTLPQRFMETHFRWLRLMVSLAVGEMERIKGRPTTGYPTLFLLDEFAGLKRMEVVENAVAQAAGFGVKFFFVLQNLPQLKDVYKDDWESFVSNSGLKVFFQIDDHFTRDYVSNLLGEREVRRESQSRSQSQSDSTSNTVGRSETQTDGTSDLPRAANRSRSAIKENSWDFSLWIRAGKRGTTKESRCPPRKAMRLVPRYRDRIPAHPRQLVDGARLFTSAPSSTRMSSGAFSRASMIRRIRRIRVCYLPSCPASTRSWRGG